jgi:hypothetical protein
MPPIHLMGPVEISATSNHWLTDRLCGSHSGSAVEEIQSVHLLKLSAILYQLSEQDLTVLACEVTASSARA